MYTIDYFKRLLKKKQKFSMKDIAKMKPLFIRLYMITGHINRLYFSNNIDKINKIRKSIMPYSKPSKLIMYECNTSIFIFKR